MGSSVSHREHGSYVRYVQGPDINDQPGQGCRCEDCRRANREYERERVRRKAPPYVGADDVRRHLAWLAEQGIGLKTVAKVSGLSTGLLSKLVYGDYGRGMRPSKRVRPATRDAILAITPANVVNGSRVEAAPTLAIVDELLQRGWSKAAIGRHVHGPAARTLQLGDELVTRKHAAAVRSLLDLPVETRLSRWGTPCATPDVDDAPEVPRGLVVGVHGSRKREERRRAAEDAGEVYAEPDPYHLPRFVLDADMSWQADGACRHDDVPLWLFFPTRGDVKTMVAAKDVCARCPVHVQCLEFALEVGPEGVWGGTSERERREMRRRSAVA